MVTMMQQQKQMMAVPGFTAMVELDHMIIAGKPTVPFPKQPSATNTLEYSSRAGLVDQSPHV